MFPIEIQINQNNNYHAYHDKSGLDLVKNGQLRSASLALAGDHKHNLYIVYLF